MWWEDPVQFVIVIGLAGGFLYAIYRLAKEILD